MHIFAEKTVRYRLTVFLLILISYTHRITNVRSSGSGFRLKPVLPPFVYALVRARHCKMYPLTGRTPGFRGFAKSQACNRGCWLLLAFLADGNFMFFWSLLFLDRTCTFSRARGKYNDSIARNSNNRYAVCVCVRMILQIMIDYSLLVMIDIMVILCVIDYVSYIGGKTTWEIDICRNFVG